MYMHTLIWGMARRGFSRLVGKNLCVYIMFLNLQKLTFHQ